MFVHRFFSSRFAFIARNTRELRKIAHLCSCKLESISLASSVIRHRLSHSLQMNDINDFLFSTVSIFFSLLTHILPVRLAIVIISAVAHLNCVSLSRIRVCVKIKVDRVHFSVMREDRNFKGFSGRIHLNLAVIVTVINNLLFFSVLFRIIKTKSLPLLCTLLKSIIICLHKWSGWKQGWGILVYKMAYLHHEPIIAENIWSSRKYDFI